MSRLVTGHGTPLLLGKELGSGGEGSVFEVSNRQEVVAKIYHHPVPPLKAAKLTAMAGARTERLERISAWPMETVCDANSRAVRGFIMNRVSRQKDIHILYGPKTRLRDYPDATYRFLVHVAANLARAFAVVHEHGHVVGDVNQGGVCVSKQGTVTLVDCDSFQIAASGQTFTCDVGIPQYQPPEFQTVSTFNGLVRQPNHDAFGLAVLIFQTLFLARHPFAGAYQGTDDMPIERAIREFRFAYARDASRRLMRQPPGSLGLGAAPQPIGELFERSFLESGAHGRRPTAAEWIAALDGFASQLKDCKRNQGHAHISTLPHCPLCEIEGRIGVLLFLPSQTAKVNAPTVDLEQLWRDLVRTVDEARVPSTAAVSKPVPPPPPPEVAKFVRAKARSQAIVWVGIAISVCLAIALHPAAFIGLILFPLIGRQARGAPPKELDGLRERLSTAKQQFDSALGQLERERTNSGLDQLRSRGEQLRQSIARHPQRRAEAMAELDRTRNHRQLRRYLDKHEVTECKITGVSRSRMQQLASFGIETADDVTASNLAMLRNARCGFGPKRTEVLMRWRRGLEARFRPVAHDPADVQERARVDRELQLEHAKEINELVALAEQARVQAHYRRARVTAISQEIERSKKELEKVLATSTAIGMAA